MPNMEVFLQKLTSFEGLMRLPALDPKDILCLERVIDTEVPNLLSGVGGVTLSKESLKTPEPPSPGTWATLFGFGGERAAKRRKTDND